MSAAVHPVPAGRSGRHADRTPTMPPRLDAAVARGSSGSGPVSGRAPHQLPCPRWLPQEPPVSALVVGVREAAAHSSGPEIAADTAWPRVPDISPVRTAVVPEAADGQSADGSGSLQLPLLLLKAGPAATRRSLHWGTGLTLHAEGSQGSHEVGRDALGLGHRGPGIRSRQSCQQASRSELRRPASCGRQPKWRWIS